MVYIVFFHVRHVTRCGVVKSTNKETLQLNVNEIEPATLGLNIDSGRRSIGQNNPPW